MKLLRGPTLADALQVADLGLSEGEAIGREVARGGLALADVVLEEEVVVALRPLVT